MDILVERARSSFSMLPCVGSRCCTRTKAIPVFSGRCESTLVNASRPPAEAPKPTIGKMCFLEGGFDGAVFFFIRLATNEHECARTRTVSHSCAFVPFLSACFYFHHEIRDLLAGRDQHLMGNCGRDVDHIARPELLSLASRDRWPACFAGCGG